MTRPNTYPDTAPGPVAADMLARAAAQGAPLIFRVLVWRDGAWSTYCHYHAADPAMSRRFAADMAAHLERRYGRRRVLVAQNDVPAIEAVILHDGPEAQHLVPGVAPVPLSLREVSCERARRAARRGDAPLPAGGLFDDTARLQQDLFA